MRRALLLAGVVLIVAFWAIAAGGPVAFLLDAFPPSAAATCGSNNFCSTQLTVAPNTDGFAWQLHWQQIETSQGVYNWTGDTPDFGRVQVYTGLTVAIGGAVRSGCPGACTTTASYTNPFGGNAPIAVGAKVLPLGMDASFNAAVGSPFTVTATTGTSVTYVDNGNANGSNSIGGTIEIACRNGQRCLFVPVLVHIANGNTNSDTPAYLGTQASADSLVGTVSFQNGKLYYNGDQVFFSGNYYQVSTSGSCTSSGTNPTNDAVCTWTNLGVHAAPQDFGFCTAYPGTNNGGVLPVNTVANANTGGIVQATLLTGYTALWETPGLVAYQNLTASYFSFIATQAWRTRIPYHRVGRFKGGEFFLQCGPQFQAVQTPANVAQLKARILAYSVNAFNSQVSQRNANGLNSENLDAALNGGNNATQTCDWSNADAANALAAGITWLGNQGLSTADPAGAVQGPCTSQTPPGTAGNWVVIFAQDKLLVNGLQLQTQSQSCPTGATDCTAQETAGSLSIMIPFAMQSNATSLELYDGDWRCTFDSTYTGPPTFAECQAANYAAFFAGARSGAFLSTSAALGNSRVAGGGALQ